MISSKEHRNTLINISKKLQKASQSIPADEHGEPTETYLEYISLMYSPEVAQIVQHLEIFPKTISIHKLAKKLGRDRNELKKVLENPSRKLFLVNLGNFYALPTPLFVYDSPFILKENYEGENAIPFAELSKKFFEKENYYKRWETSRKGRPRMRILTVSEKIEHESIILPVEEVYSIIDRFDQFALIPCPCRKRTEIMGIRKCKDKYPILNCILMGNFATIALIVKDPVIKRVTKEEVKVIAKKASELGLVHATDNHSENLTILCSCCECCCGMLRGLIEFENPKAIAKANYIAQVDGDTCTACETCLERCKFGAIFIDKIANINPEKCMGCGLCAVTCPNDAISMKRVEREKIPGLEM